MATPKCRVPIFLGNAVDLHTHACNFKVEIHMASAFPQNSCVEIRFPNLGEMAHGFPHCIFGKCPMDPQISTLMPNTFPHTEHVFWGKAV